MSDLTEWLLACITEDEAEAREWKASYSPLHPTLAEPEHVLAVCKAHREIVEAYGATRQSARRDAPTHGRGWNEYDGHLVTVDGATLRGSAASEFISRWYEDCPAQPAIRSLAAIYADRPGYREEWKP